MRSPGSFQSLTAACLIVAGMICVVQASEFRTMGPRALSMGGAAVACPTPAYAAYYNPAALGLDDRGAFDIALGLNIRDTGLTEHLDPLSSYDWNTAIDNPQGPDAAAIITELRTIKSTDALMIMPDGAVGLRIGSFAGGVFASAQIVAYGHLDTVHLNKTSPLDDPNSFAFNSSTLYAQGLGLVEVPLAYGHAFNMRESGTISVGGALKFIEGATYDIRQGILITSDSEQLRKKLEDGSEISAGFGVDLGVIYRTAGDGLSLGLLARNVNSPAFVTATGASFAEDAQIRAGAAYNITKQLLVALDIDVTANKTLIPGHNSRQISTGIGYEGSIGSIRAGLMKNIEGDGAPIAWSLGLSLGGETFHLDLAGSVASSWQKYDDYNFPVEGGFTLALGGGW